MKKFIPFLILAALILSGCGTTGKDVKTTTNINISNNTGSINISPDVSTESGDASNSSANETTTPVDVPLNITNPADILSGAVQQAVGSEIIDAAGDISADPIVEATGKETGTYHGRYNDDRPTWYLSKPMISYPSSFTVDVEGCSSLKVIDHNGERFESGEMIVKQSDVAGRGMALVWPSSCKSEKASVSWQ